MTASSSKPPGRAVLRLAGVFTQVACAACLLLGTIAFVLVQQNKSGGGGAAIAWGAAAMVGLVVGGMMARGGMIAVLISALLDAGFGIVLLVLDSDALAGILRVLPATDVEMIGDALVGAAIGMLVVAALCLLSIPQALRYGRWLREGANDLMPAGSTERGFPPPPVSALQGSMWRAPTAPPAERRSRRRMYFALGGFAIGFGAGIGVLVSSTTRSSSTTATTVVASKPDDKKPDDKKPDDKTPPDKVPGKTPPDDDKPGSLFKPPPPKTTVQTMLQDQRAALSRGDLKAVAATVWTKAIGFGTEADEVVEVRDAIEAQLRRDLGDLPSDGVTVDTKFSQLGSEQNHVWIAQELELSAPGRSTRRYAVTQLAAAINGTWQVVAWHWAVPVRDDVAERLAVLGTKPAVKSIGNKLEGPKELDAAVRTAFGSRVAFVDARSTRSDGFNFGSGPSERIVGGDSIKRIFKSLRAEIHLHDGARVMAGGTWDPAQAAKPWIGVALVNADFTSRTRAATELTQTFRVLAIVIAETDGWKIVQTQWSHGGPIR
ncbi:MAG: nuclear transport factor 2 family protein [Kofleriaceae bacterium]